jgi:hypothetical protein
MLSCNQTTIIIHKRERMNVMTKRPTAIALVAFVMFISVLSLRATPDDSIPFPKEYRQWAHVKSALVGPQSAAFATEAGIHHIYANDKALEGYRTGKFPDGAIIVYDLLETKETDGVTSEGPQRRVDVMVKASQHYRETGGWGFASFRGDNRTEGRLTAERQTACFNCHAKRKAYDCVFSEFRN